MSPSCAGDRNALGQAGVDHQVLKSMPNADSLGITVRLKFGWDSKPAAEKHSYDMVLKASNRQRDSTKVSSKTCA